MRLQLAEADEREPRSAACPFEIILLFLPILTQGGQLLSVK
ncbi:hypothetical protein STRDD11_02569 [Streptococcus sp. DD11]|nr:hypothetical protein STRDD11_02569 [Streptococcus sp. DD11]